MSQSKHNRVKKTKHGHKITSSHKDWKARTAYAKESIKVKAAEVQAQKLFSLADLGSGIKTKVKGLFNKKQQKEKASGAKKGNTNK